MKRKFYTVDFIVAIVQNWDKLSATANYKSEFLASDMLLDLEIILKKAKLTDKQQLILDKHWREGYTQEEVAITLGITQQMVEKHCRAIKKKIEKILNSMEEYENDVQ